MRAPAHLYFRFMLLICKRDTMKTFVVTLILAAATLGLSACETASSKYSGANYASDRTAGHVHGAFSK